MLDAWSTHSECSLIDPVLETAERDAQYVKEMGLDLKYAINTHCHADHVTGTAALKASFPSMVTAISKVSGARAELLFEEGVGSVNFMYLSATLYNLLQLTDCVL
jgi:sulfur dioxygenase